MSSHIVVCNHSHTYIQKEVRGDFIYKARVCSDCGAAIWWLLINKEDYTEEDDEETDA
jgi:hypothetical protein